MPNDIIVRYNIILKGTPIENYDVSSINHNVPKLLFWHNGEYVNYSGIFGKVLSYNDNIWKIYNIWSKKNVYIVTDKNNTYADGETIHQAIEKLRKKKTIYKKLTLDSQVTIEQVIDIYQTFMLGSKAETCIEKY